MDHYYQKLGIVPELLTREKRRELVLRNELKLEELKQIGHGLFGCVYSARHLPSNKKNQAVKKVNRQVIACKVTDCKNELSSIQWQCFINEVKAFRTINHHKHPHIVRFDYDFHMFVEEKTNKVKFEVNTHNLVEKPNYRTVLCGIIIEKLDMSLRQWMNTNNLACLSEEQAKQLFGEIGSALQLLHREHYLVHLDVKAGNIGVTGKITPGTSMPTMKLYDFGTARTCDKVQFTAAEEQSTTFQATEADDHFDLKVNDNVVPSNAFMQEAKLFDKTIYTTMALKNETLDRCKDDRFRKIVLGMANANLSINSALERYEYTIGRNF